MKTENEIWEENYNNFIDYLEEHEGKYPNKENIKMYIWVKTQRYIHNSGEKDSKGNINYLDMTLTPRQIFLLELIGFKWQKEDEQLENKQEEKAKKEYIEETELDEDSLIWDDYYKLLLEYMKKYNNNLPKAKEIYRGVLLGKWTRKMKMMYIGNTKMRLTTSQLEKLKELKIKWVSQEKKYYEKEILNEQHLKGMKRVMEAKTLEILDANNAQEIFKSKEQINNINKQLIKRLSVSKQNKV